MQIGKDTKHWNPSNLYGCKIGDNCIIAAFSEIQSGVTIGNNCKIEMGAFIPTGVKIGNGVFIGPNVCFTNDKCPRAVNPDGSLQTGDNWVCLETIVEDNVSIGANSTILPGITIGKGTMIGAGSTVTKNVPQGSLVVGNPAKAVRTVKKNG